MKNLEIKILDPKDEKLRQISTEVTDFDNPIYQSVLEEIKEICIHEKAYASAAPQFGILKRFVLIMTIEEMRVDSVEELEEKEINYTITPYFNPRIVVMKGEQHFYEACMSVDKTIGKVIRPYYIEVEAQDINGNHFTKIAEDFEAIVLCHEIDHLDGIEFTDKAEDISYDVDLEARLEIRKLSPHVIISKDGEFNQNLLEEKVKTKIYKKKLNN